MKEPSEQWHKPLEPLKNKENRLDYCLKASEETKKFLELESESFAKLSRHVGGKTKRSNHIKCDCAAEKKTHLIIDCVITKFKST